MHSYYSDVPTPALVFLLIIDCDGLSVTVRKEKTHRSLLTAAKAVWLSTKMCPTGVLRMDSFAIALHHE